MDERHEREPRDATTGGPGNGLDDVPDDWPDDVPDRVADARVRALLADAGRATRPERVPDDVAARLDATLAGLVAEREDASVVPLRRRWAPRLAAAAAAVIVLGAGGLAATGLGVFGDDHQADSATSGAAEGGASSAQSDAGAQAVVPALTAASFDRDVARLLASGPVPLRPEARQEAQDSAAPACSGPEGRAGSERREVRLDGRRAVLLVDPPRDGRRVVEAWTCDGGRRLAVTTVTG